MKKIIVPLLVIGLLLTTTLASVNAEVKQRELMGSLSADTIYVYDHFDNHIEELMEYGHMPSLVACIVKNNTVVWSKGYGHSCIYYNEKNTTVDTVYPIASVTKSITATAIMQLNESGLIGLDDNVSEYLSFDLKNPKYLDINITFRMLLAHQSSIADFLIRYLIFFTFLKFPANCLNEYFSPNGSLYHKNVWNDYRPGEDVCYSTMGFVLLGHLVEQVTHQSFADYCQEHVFEPLKMKNTSFYFSDFNKDQLACLYRWIAGVYLPIPRIQGDAIVHAGGGLKTTISDLSHFLMMHTNGGVYNGIRILKVESVEEMHRIQYSGCYDEGFLHGLGWYSWNSSTGETYAYGGHAGGYGGACAKMSIRYSDKVGVLYFWNQNSFLRMHFNLMRLEEEEAIREIEKALFEKADEL